MSKVPVTNVEVVSMDAKGDGANVSWFVVITFANRNRAIHRHACDNPTKARALADRIVRARLNSETIRWEFWHSVPDIAGPRLLKSQRRVS